MKPSGLASLGHPLYIPPDMYTRQFPLCTFLPAVKAKI